MIFLKAFLLGVLTILLWQTFFLSLKGNKLYLLLVAIALPLKLFVLIDLLFYSGKFELLDTAYLLGGFILPILIYTILFRIFFQMK